MDSFPYIWRWGTCGGKYPELGKRRGQPCRVVARGAMNSCLIRFEDGVGFVASRNGLKRRGSDTCLGNK
jgi:hypothetical protein